MQSCGYTRSLSSALLPFYLGVSLLKPNIRKKGTLMFKGLPGNLVQERAAVKVKLAFGLGPHLDLEFGAERLPGSQSLVKGSAFGVYGFGFGV